MGTPKIFFLILTTLFLQSLDVYASSASFKSCGVGKNCVPESLCSKTDSKDDNIVTECSYSDVCCAAEDQISATEFSCGDRNPEDIGFGVRRPESDETTFGEFPWMTGLLHESNGELKIVCGGSLITPNVVLTSAHCVHGKPENILKVRAGEWDTTTRTELYPHQDRQVTEIIVHADFNRANMHNDIALLILDTPFELAPNVKTICLPPANLTFHYLNCYASGWGKKPTGDNHSSPILKKVQIDVIPNTECQDRLRNTKLGNQFQLDGSFICAVGVQGKDMCQGDGGAPLVCPISNTGNRFYQAGIVSWGIGCGEANVPGAYAAVSILRTWIDEQLAKKQIDSSFFDARVAIPWLDE